MLKFTHHHTHEEARQHKKILLSLFLPLSLSLSLSFSVLLSPLSVLSISIPQPSSVIDLSRQCHQHLASVSLCRVIWMSECLQIF